MYNEKVGRKAGTVLYQRAGDCCFSRILPTPEPWKEYQGKGEEDHILLSPHSSQRNSAGPA